MPSEAHPNARREPTKSLSRIPIGEVGDDDVMLCYTCLFPLVQLMRAVAAATCESEKKRLVALLIVAVVAITSPSLQPSATAQLGCVQVHSRRLGRARTARAGR